MDHLETLKLFTRIVETGSFSRAADMLDIPRATATYAMQQLEARLHTRLLERTTRQVRSTLDGQAFYERCVHILSELDEAESSLRHIASNPRGILRIDMHGTHATKIILPKIGEFREHYPNIDLVVSGGDRLVDLVREGVDCVIRGGNPRDSTLVVRRLAMMPQVICASPQYLKNFGTPRTPDELLTHRAIKFFASSGNVDYPFELIVNEQTRQFAANGWMSVNDAENYVVCAVSGCGLIQLPRFHVEEELRSGQLVEVLAEWPSPDLPVSALYPYRRQLSLRIRVFIDWVSRLYEEKFGAYSQKISP